MVGVVAPVDHSVRVNDAPAVSVMGVPVQPYNVSDAAIDGVGNASTVTVICAVDVHDAESVTEIVYVVVVDGEACTTGPDVASKPAGGDHAIRTAVGAVARSVATEPAHTVVSADGVTVGKARARMVTVCTMLHPNGSVARNVTTVVAFTVALGCAAVLSSNNAPGDHR
jgi:hypothetical protein